MPCGKSGALPIGLQIVGKAFAEPLIFRSAACLEPHLG
jgi:Asp-tRNA(Asn)/Glu-tRNA(Gln) amidotransferase A subunit family amidase